MTTIAWDGETLAGDRLVCWGTSRDGQATKIAKKGPVLAAVSGALGPGQQFMDWFVSGMVGEPPAMPDGERTTFCWIVTPDDLLLTWGPHGWERQPLEQASMGSGAHFALGAMEMGADAVTAVKVAMKHCTKTGGEVQSVRR